MSLELSLFFIIADFANDVYTGQSSWLLSGSKQCPSLSGCSGGGVAKLLYEAKEEVYLG
jgi:hypothetical protein